MNPIIIEARGDPKGQPRARAFYKPGLGVRMYDPGSAEGWKGQIAQAARFCASLGILGPVRVDIDFRFKRPKSHFRTGKHAGELRPDALRWHTKKPDLDNAAKAVFDCLTQIGVWKDDCQVCAGEIRKVWASVGGATIKITELLASLEE